MRVFLSYAAEHRAVADSVALRLRQAGHSVFFDRDELPAAEGFDDRIRKGLRRSDLQSEARASVRVSLQQPLGQHSGAGLLYRKQPGRPDHYVFMLMAGGAVSLARVAKSLQVVWSAELGPGATVGPVKLTIEGEGRHLRLYVDDRLVHTASDDPPLSGDPGVFAMSTGCFVFDDVAVYLPAGRPSSVPR